jgi:large subunit ribosomal protein L4
MAAMRRLVFNFQQKLVLGNAMKPVKYIFNPAINRCFSTAPLSGEVKVRGEVVSIPSNLQLFDATILRPEPEPQVKIEDYSFPLLNVPSSMDVVQFKNPNEKAAPVPLVKTIFEVAIRKDIVLTLVRYIRNQRRQPKKTKRMSEISGSNKKPRPQKGTGTGQVGHHRNSAWRKGQKAHGPVIRDYSIGMNKKQRALGMMMVLAAKFREGNLHVVDSFDLDVSNFAPSYCYFLLI